LASMVAMKSLAPGPLPPAHTNKYDDWLIAACGATMTVIVAVSMSTRRVILINKW
jgi:hypothetical protein